ncbi:hypothetical protein LguiB_022047 [Lonicera macranthoides]
MENYSYNSYPESGNSSPRSREIDFENPSPWEDQQPPPNYKVKFMCSYGGKIQPRPHDNQLAYVGGETKILAVDRSIRFSALVSKLSSHCDNDVCFKYQLPGEDLDALISVTNDDDLEHMMTEYDRLYRASPKPARLRLFCFPANQSSAASTRSAGSTDGKLDKEHFLEALNSGPAHPAAPPSAAAAAVVAPPSKVDFLFGLEREMPAKVRDAIADPVITGSDVPVHRIDDRDPIQKHIQDLQRLHIGEQQAMYQQRKNDENLGGGFAGDYYVQKMPEKVAPATIPGTVPVSMPIPQGYLPEKQISGGVFPATTFSSDQQVYMIPAPSGMYQSPMGRPEMGRPVAGPTGQGYYGMQRMPHEVYRDQPLYNMVQQTQQAAPSQQPPRTVAYSEGYGMVRPGMTAGMGMTDAGYAQMAYDSGGGRQVYYNAKGGVVAQQTQPQYQAVAGPPYGGDMRTAGGFNQEGGKVVAAKVSQASI